MAALPPIVPLFRRGPGPAAPVSTRTSSEFTFTDAASSRVMSLDERNLIASLIADLSDNCETAFARAHIQAHEWGPRYSELTERDCTDRHFSRRSRPRTRGTATSYTPSNLREDLREIRPYLRESTLLALEGILANGMGLRDEMPKTPKPPTSPLASSPLSPQSGEGYYVPVILDSHQPSGRSSYSRPNSVKFDDEPDESGIFPRDKRRSTKSNLRHPMDDNTPPDNLRSTFESDMAGTIPPAPAYPSKAKTAIIMFSLYIAIFLVALDRTIIGPAIPAITNDFKSIDDIGWYGSSYMLTAAGFILLYGRVYTFFSTKTVFLSGIFLFEIGSVVCGAATSSTMLIVGRAIAGLGSSGIFTGAILIMLNTVPLEKRPMLQGLFGACFGVASVAGPLLGGAFTQSSASWRWCFWINLPLGGVTILVVFFMLKLDEQKQKLKGWGEIVRQLDPLGTLLFLPSITCLLLALEWGAAEYSWSSPRIIALLVVFAVLLVAFIAWQYVTRHTTATIPAHIILQQSVACGGASQFCVGATMLTVSIYIPLWFQAIKGVSAMQSGINTIPLVLSVVVGSILSGGLVQRFGYYTPFMIFGSVLMALGVGLITTWNVNTSNGMWIGYQILVGFGVGSTMQHPNIAVQTVLRKQDVPTGTAILSLCQTLGGAVFTAVGQNLYISKFTDGLKEIGGLEPQRVLSAGATEITKNIPDDVKARVLEAYNVALTKGTFFAALIIACFALPAALGMEWRSVKNKQDPPQQSAPNGDVEKQDGQAQPPRGILKNAAATDGQDDAPLAPPAPSWRKTFRASGHFSSYLTAKVNPDLRGELKAPK
ncbi:hypothetical protein COCMIDRAFT_99949 [Bipolaris oryzae ATCC 44560]|uniref:Major facilitator superfamily (MFS) profile domain-containing protein n=2 Tax=Cochliobolus miyabeanus TaxID=101162 RepID=W6ZJL1_COCMI|nr:uncharacterized protein COCMIDRAFT_99949 [Bipolaris oryzae ATCC 44560]EUC43791.1 hypothetical protein COCMIDRAFT_99949 [Bipolaris oryzae ATCC 44560]